MQSTSTRAGLAYLRWFAKKNYVVKSLKALQLEVVFCSTRGTLTKKQESLAKRKARSLIYSLNHYKRICNLSVNHAVNLN